MPSSLKLSSANPAIAYGVATPIGRNNRLQELPDELVLIVFDDIKNAADSTPKTRLKTFHSLCSTSSTLSRVATPYLYRTIHNHLVHTAKLVRTLVEHTSLAEMIKCIHWKDGPLENDSPRNLLDIIQANLLLGRKFAFEQMLLVRIELRDYAAVPGVVHSNNIAIILFLTSQVESITITRTHPPRSDCYTPCPFSTTSLASFPGTAFNLNSRLKQIKTIHLDMRAVGLPLIACLWKLSQLRYLKLSYVSQSYDSESIAHAVDYRFSSIHHLILDHAYIGNAVPVQLLSSIKALVSFELLNANWNSERFWCSLDYQMLSKGLLLHNDTLESLIIKGKSPGGFFTTMSTGYLTCLESMHAIRTLLLCASAIPGNVIPPNVEDLRLLVDAGSYAAWIALHGAASALWDQWSMTPQMKKMELVVRAEDRPTWVTKMTSRVWVIDPESVWRKPPVWSWEYLVWSWEYL